MGYNNKYLLLLIPLMLSSIILFTIYNSVYSTYYYNYKKLITDDLPDYGIYLENKTIYQDSNIGKTSFLKEYNLEKISNVGYFHAMITVNNNVSLPFTVFWASDNYFKDYTNLTIQQNEIFLDSNLKSQFHLELNSSITFQFSVGSYVNHSTDLIFNRYVSLNHLFDIVNYLSEDLLILNEGEFFSIITTSTFKEQFENFVSDLRLSNIVLFEYNNEILKAKNPKTIDNYLYNQQEKINNYFGYSIDYYNYNQVELRLRTYSLDNLLKELDETKNNFSRTYIIYYYLVCFIFSVYIIKYTVSTYSLTQYSKIRFFLIRGGRRYNLILSFITNELRMILVGIIPLFSISILIFSIFSRSLLLFRYIYFMILSFNVQSLFLFGACQLFFMMKTIDNKKLFTLRTRDVKYTKKILIFHNLVSSLYSLIIVFIIFYFFRTFIFSILVSHTYGDSSPSLFFNVLFLYISLIITIILMLKNLSLWVGTKILYLIKYVNKIGKYSYKSTINTIKQNSILAQLLIIFSLLLSFSLVVMDSYSNYTTQHYKLNQRGDIVVSYPLNEINFSQINLAPYCKSSIEIFHGTTLIPVQNEQNEFFDMFLNVYLINYTKIPLIFNLDKFNKNYFGYKNSTELIEKFSTDNSSIIINKSFSEMASVKQNDYIYIPTRDEYFIEGKTIYTYNATILDVSQFIPFFSGNSPYDSFAIASSKFEARNLTRLGVQTVFQIIWLKDDVSLDQFRSEIVKLNEEYNIEINEIKPNNLNLFNEDYFLNTPILKQLLITIIIILCLYQLLFYVSYFQNLIESQINSYGIFFSRGLSLKKGLVLAFLPVFLFSISYILLGSFIGYIISFFTIKAFQPPYYLSIKIVLWPHSLISLLIQILIISLVVLFSSLISYSRLKKMIPIVCLNDDFRLLLQENL